MGTKRGAVRDSSAHKAAQEQEKERAIRASWKGMHMNARQADADEAADQVADDYTAFADAVIAEPTVCQGPLCPKHSSACTNCELSLERVLFH